MNNLSGQLSLQGRTLQRGKTCLNDDIDWLLVMLYYILVQVNKNRGGCNNVQ